MLARRDALFAELAALWSSGAPMVSVGGVRVPRRQEEARILKELRPLCFQIANAPKPAAKPKGKAKKGAGDATS